MEITTQDFFNALYNGEDVKIFFCLKEPKGGLHPSGNNLLHRSVKSVSITGKHDEYFMPCLSHGVAAGQKGITDDTIYRCDSVFIDFDEGQPLPEKWHLQPSAIVKREDGKGWHVYWFIHSTDNVKLWRQVVKQLIAYYGSDPAVSNPARWMRVPGSTRYKLEKDPTRQPLKYEIIQCDNVRYSLESLIKSLPAPKHDQVQSWVKETPEALLITALETIRDAPEGERNKTLNFWAGKVLQRFPEDKKSEIINALTDSARKAGLDSDEITSTLNSAKKYVEGKRLHASSLLKRSIFNADVPLDTPAARYFANIEKAFFDSVENIDVKQYELSEKSTALLFVDVIGYDWFRYNSTLSRFMIWTETRWTEDLWHLTERSMTLVTRLIQLRLAEAEINSIKEAAGIVKRLNSASGIKSILFFLASDPRIVTSQTDYDNDPDLLNTPAGTIHLPTGEMRPHKQSDLITRMTRFSPEDRPAAMFNQFLNDISCNRRDLVDAFQRFFGSSCSGRSPKERFSVNYGTGANGKSVLIEAVADVLGDYAKPIDARSLSCEQRAAGHTDDLATLAGVRFAYSSENNQGVRLDEARVKKLTGGDSVSVSFKGARTFSTRFCFTLTISTNHKPKITGRDIGIWRRVLFFPFDFKIPDDKKDLNFKTKLLEVDGGYVLTWLIQGCQLWHESGFGEFDTVKNATAEYKSGEDVISQFIVDCCELDPDAQISANDLRNRYEFWARDNGEHIFSGRAWREALEEHGLRRKHTRAGKVWRGIRMQATPTSL